MINYLPPHSEEIHNPFTVTALGKRHVSVSFVGYVLGFRHSMCPGLWKAAPWCSLACRLAIILFIKSSLG